MEAGVPSLRRNDLQIVEVALILIVEDQAIANPITDPHHVYGQLEIGSRRQRHDIRIDHREGAGASGGMESF